MASRLTAGQKEQVLNESTGSRTVSIVEGKAGTGKTLASRIGDRFDFEVLGSQGQDLWSCWNFICDDTGKSFPDSLISLNPQIFSFRP
jgi:hypothetical protein